MDIPEINDLRQDISEWVKNWIGRVILIKDVKEELTEDIKKAVHDALVQFILELICVSGILVWISYWIKYLFL